LIEKKSDIHAQSFNPKTNRTSTQGIFSTSNYVILTLKLFWRQCFNNKRFTSIKTRHKNNKDTLKKGSKNNIKNFLKNNKGTKNNNISPQHNRPSQTHCTWPIVCTCYQHSTYFNNHPNPKPKPRS